MSQPRNTMKALNNFLTVYAMNTRQAWFHRRAATASVLSWAIRMGLTILLYAFIYQLRNGAPVNGIDFKVAASGMVLYAIVLGFGYRDLFKTINREFKSGGIEAWLNKPISYIQLKVAESFGKNMPVVFGLVGAAGLFWLFSGQFPLVDGVWLRMFAGVILLGLGLAIATLLYVLVGLSVVWLQEAQPIYLILDKLIMIFGGAFIPIGFFPTALRLIGESLPTGAAIYVTQMFYPDFIANLPRFLITQVLWLGLLACAVMALSKAANAQLTVNGG